MAQDPQQQEAQQEAMKQWGQVVARAWSDDAYKQRLLSDPRTVLAEAGLSVPPTLQVQVHEATPTLLHLVLPPPPQDVMSDDELDQVSGGYASGFDFAALLELVSAPIDWRFFRDGGFGIDEMFGMQTLTNSLSSPMGDMSTAGVDASNQAASSMARGVKGG